MKDGRAVDSARIHGLLVVFGLCYDAFTLVQLTDMPGLTQLPRGP